MHTNTAQTPRAHNMYECTECRCYRTTMCCSCYLLRFAQSTDCMSTISLSLIIPFFFCCCSLILSSRSRSFGNSCPFRMSCIHKQTHNLALRSYAFASHHPCVQVDGTLAVSENTKPFLRNFIRMRR